MRYFFHFMAGSVRLDDDLGIGYDHPASARRDAVRAAREMVADMLRRAEPVPADGSIEITDERGRLVDCIALTEAAFGVVTDSRFRRVFHSLPQACLLLAPNLAIVEANRAFLKAAMTEAARIVGRPLFDAFPGNPGNRTADGARNLAASLDAVLRGKAEDAMPVQAFDIRRPDGAWETRYWKPTNIPILDADGEVELIVHQVEDLTGAMTREPSTSR